MDEEYDPSIVEYFGGDDGHKCGYCKGKKNNFSNGEYRILSSARKQLL